MQVLGGRFPSGERPTSRPLFPASSSPRYLSFCPSRLPPLEPFHFPTFKTSMVGNFELFCHMTRHMTRAWHGGTPLPTTSHFPPLSSFPPETAQQRTLIALEHYSLMPIRTSNPSFPNSLLYSVTRSIAVSFKISTQRNPLQESGRPCSYLISNILYHVLYLLWPAI